MSRALQGAERGDDRGVEIGDGRGDRPPDKGRCVHLVLGVQHEDRIHRLFARGRWLHVVEHAQEGRGV
jgi:hypothetical protein